MIDDLDDDEVISSPLVAVHAIQKRGYLTYLETPADAWYEIGTRPLEQDEYGQRIRLTTALTVIQAGMVQEVARGHPPGDATTRAVSYVTTAMPRQ